MRTSTRMDPAAPGATVGRVAVGDRSPGDRFERAIARFNASEAARTVAGLTRTLGEPRVSIGAAARSPSEVRVTVAWELGWYQWSVDLGNGRRPVSELGKGEEIDQLDGSARQWNARAGEGAQIALGFGPPRVRGRRRTGRSAR